MNEHDYKNHIATNDFTDELSDEALDRSEVRACLSNLCSCRIIEAVRAPWN